MGRAPRPVAAGLGMILALSAEVAGAVMPHRAGRAGYHGAIAVQRDTGAVGLSYDFRTAREARSAALGQCGHPQCEVIAAVQNGCAAVAHGAGRYHHATGATRDEAQTKAARLCANPGECKPLAWTCTK